MQWKDTSSYSKDDKERTPREYTLKLNSIRICVHRHIDYNKDEWLLSCSRLRIEKHLLMNTDLEYAKDEAMGYIIGIVNAINSDLERFLCWK